MLRTRFVLPAPEKGKQAYNNRQAASSGFGGERERVVIAIRRTSEPRNYRVSNEITNQKQKARRLAVQGGNNLNPQLEVWKSHRGAVNGKASLTKARAVLALPSIE